MVEVAGGRKRKGGNTYDAPDNAWTGTRARPPYFSGLGSGFV